MSDSGAVISECGAYRYHLWRKWSDDAPACVFAMLNPSTADAEQDDPTIRRCLGFARALGCGSLHVVNLFAIRATDPKVMLKAADPVGPENEAHIKRVCGMALPLDFVICAWGAHGGHRGHDRRVLGWIRDAGAQPMALKLTKDGFPQHPLYLAADLRPVPYLKGAPR